MGVAFDAECRCGYSGIAHAGSSRSEHGKSFCFPYRCYGCEKVVSVDVLAGSTECPECKSKATSMYGAARKQADIERESTARTSVFSKLFGRGGVKIDDTEGVPINEEYCFVTDTTYSIDNVAYACPRCSKQTLFFTINSFYS